MVAASKLRGAQARVTKSRGIWQPFTRLLGDSPGAPPWQLLLPFFCNRMRSYISI